MPTKSDLSFDELLKAGLRTPPQPASPPKTPRPKRQVAKKRRKQVRSGS